MPSYVFPLYEIILISWLLGAIAIKLNCSGKGGDCRKEGWSCRVEKNPVLLYFTLVTDFNVRCL